MSTCASRSTGLRPKVPWPWRSRLAGETSSRTPQGVLRVKAGESAKGHTADTAMQVSSTGTEDLRSLMMFVVDAARPFSSPAQLPH